MRRSCPALALMLTGVLGGIGSARAAEVIELRATGSQIYVCSASTVGFGWVFRAPEAVLRDNEGHVVGRHFAGPSWQAADGSVVTGEVVANAAAPLPGAVPWLVLRAKTHEGAGTFEAVSMIVRSRTEGGAMPSGGCDAASSGSERRVPYTASYTLFPQDK